MIVCLHLSTIQTDEMYDAWFTTCFYSLSLCSLGGGMSITPDGGNCTVDISNCSVTNNTAVGSVFGGTACMVAPFFDNDC